MGFLSSHHRIGNSQLGMDYEHVNILRLDTIFKDAIQSLMNEANNYVQCVVTVPCNLGGLPKLQKSECTADQVLLYHLWWDPYW